MKLLLDTHVLIWLLLGSSRLKDSVREQIDTAEEIFVSAASIWEIAIKRRLGNIDADPDEIVAILSASRIRALPVSYAHAAMVARLPDYHRDPFDRLLVAQAMLEPLRLLSSDSLLARYSENVQII